MNAINHSDEEIRRILTGICDLTLPKSDWTHEAHFAAAIAMMSDSRFDAFKDMPKTIKAYNIATGVQNTDHDGYHHTITIASLFAVRAMTKDRRNPLIVTLREILSAEYGQSNWLLTYWSKETLFSVEARKTWVEPDIRHLPFETT